jgi:hypothetical protein
LVWRSTCTGKIFVADDASGILVFAPAASGNTAPIAQISGAATTIMFPEGMAVDANDNIYVSDCTDQAVLVFAAGSNGNVAPAATIKGASTTLTCPLKLEVR